MRSVGVGDAVAATWMGLWAWFLNVCSARVRKMFALGSVWLSEFCVAVLLRLF